MSIETWDQYQTLALRTAPPLPDVIQLEHARSGWVTEVGELADCYKRHIYYMKPMNTVNLREEIGDILWYVALAASVLGHTLYLPDALDEDMYSNMGIQVTLHKHVSRLLTDVPTAQDLQFIVAQLTGLCYLEEIDMKQCLRMNIAKLSKRFGDRFNAEAAMVRDLQAELQALKDAAA